jgi:hypothetical protein
MNEALDIAPASGDTLRKPRGVLEVVVQWSLPSPADRLEARLVWFTRGKGTEDVGIVATERIESPEARGQRRIRFTLPDAPYSFSGRLISLLWAVELVADRAAVRWEFVLAPEGREILLMQPADAPRLR